MRRLLLTTLALAALCVGSTASAAPTVTKLVKITKTAFSPSSVSIKTSDSVKWTNTDTENHQVVSNTGAFVSPVLAPGKSYSHRFSTSGTYRYHDGLHPSITGKVVVSGPPAAVTVGASLPIITYGERVTLSGAVSNGAANEQVTLFQQPYGQASYTEVTTVLTVAGGAYGLQITPTLTTNYFVKWKGTSSAPIAVSVMPRIKFAKISGGRFGTHVYGARSFGGRWVYVQRLSRFGQWVNVRKVTLGSNSGRAFKLTLPRGYSRLRVFMTVNQAGAGYLNGISPTIRVRRR